jgi:hypothetical protein
MTGTNDRAAPGRGETSGSSNPFYFLPYERELFPIEGSIRWTPHEHRSAERRALHQPDIVIEQRVFVRLRHEMVRDLEEETVGILLGHVLECPSTQRVWVDVVASIGAPLAIDRGPDPATVDGAHFDSADALEDALLSLFEEPCWTGGVPVGWYRTRPGSDTLTEAEAEVHRRLFSESWQFNLLMLSDLTAPKGAVFWRNDGENLQPDRHWPFFERLDGSTDPTARPPFTCVGFSNYETAAPVVPASPPPSGRGRAGQRLTPLVMAPSGRSIDPVRRGRRSALALAASVVIVGGAGLVLRERPVALSSAPDTPLFSAPFAVRELPGISGDATFGPEFEAFRTEVYGYYELAEAYQGNDVGCDSVTGAYRAADDAFIALSGKVAAARDEGESAIPSTYRSAAEVMRGIDQHFDAFGCPRPR